MAAISFSSFSERFRVTVREAKTCSEPFTAMIWMEFSPTLRSKDVENEPALSGVTSCPFTSTFEFAGVTSPFTSMESLVTVGDPEGELIASSGLGVVSFPPPLPLFFSPLFAASFASSFPPPLPANAARPARQPPTKVKKTNTPRMVSHPRSAWHLPPPSGGGACAAAASSPPTSPACGGGGTGTSASGVGTVAA